MKTIGLTGGIGSGKSTVAEILEELGATVIHADLVGHEVYRPHTDGWRAVVAAFGREILASDGTIDRKRLGAIVFGDVQARARLNAIVHPLIATEIRHRISTHRTRGQHEPIIVEAAVLIEANWLSLVDEVWLVVADRSAVEERLARQRNLSLQEVGARIGSQSSDEERQRHAQVVIRNTGSMDELRSQVRELWARAARA